MKKYLIITSVYDCRGLVEGSSTVIDFEGCNLKVHILLDHPDLTEDEYLEDLDDDDLVDEWKEDDNLTNWTVRNDEGYTHFEVVEL